MIRLALACLLALTACTPAAAARGHPGPVQQFAGDRYVGRMAQGASAGDVTRAVRTMRRKARHKTRRLRWAPPLTLAQGMTREAGQALRGRPRAWCGWWLGRHLGMHDRRLWLARNWAAVGSRAHGPQVGAIVVWRHHVGIITGHTARGWVVKSGNDGHAVRERVRSVSRAIAFRSI